MTLTTVEVTYALNGVNATSRVLNLGSRAVAVFPAVITSGCSYIYPCAPHIETPIGWVETYRVPRRQPRSGIQNVEILRIGVEPTIIPLRLLTRIAVDD